MLLVKWDWLGMKESLSDLLELDNVAGNLKFP